MAYFKTEWLVLKVKKISENQSLYIIFFKDYGILTVSKKKKIREKPIDSWYLISCEIITKKTQEIHLIGNIHIIAFFSAAETEYKTVKGFLYLLHKVHSELPHGNPHYEIYNIVSLSLRNTLFSHYDLVLLAHLKIMSFLGNLSDTHSSPITDKTLKCIHKYNYRELCKLWKIPIETKKDLEKICSLV